MGNVPVLISSAHLGRESVHCSFLWNCLKGTAEQDIMIHGTDGQLWY